MGHGPASPQTPGYVDSIACSELKYVVQLMLSSMPSPNDLGSQAIQPTMIMDSDWYCDGIQRQRNFWPLIK